MTTPHGFMPGAIVKNIAPGSSDPAIIPVAVSQHIAVSNADSLFGLFSNDGGIESHFYIRKDGTIEQYRSIFFQADAQFDSNHPDMGVVSVEHQGGVGADLNQPMPKPQLDAFHRVILFVRSQSPAGDLLFRVCPAYNKPGVGYHAMFEEWNLNHHSCPGPARIKQFHDVTVPWLKAQAAPKPAPAHVVARAPRRAVFHVARHGFYYTEDSLRGVKAAIAKRFGWIDLDVSKLKDGTLVVAHGPAPLAKRPTGGYHDTNPDQAKRVTDVGVVFSELTWDQVKWFRSNDGKGYTIWRADHLIPLAVKLGIRVEFEAKSRDITAADFQALRALLPDPKRMQVKAFPGKLPSLHAAHEAGFTTIALTHPGHTRVPRSAAKWLDYFRGDKPVWI